MKRKDEAWTIPNKPSAATEKEEVFSSQVSMFSLLWLVCHLRLLKGPCRVQFKSRVYRVEE